MYLKLILFFIQCKINKKTNLIITPSFYITYKDNVYICNIKGKDKWYNVMTQKDFYVPYLDVTEYVSFKDLLWGINYANYFKLKFFPTFTQDNLIKNFN